MLKRIRSEAGQTAAEYMGGLLLVGVIVAAIAFTDVGGRIEYHARVLVCKIGGGTDCGRVAGNPDAPTLDRCITKSSDKSIQGSVKVLVFKLEGGVEGVLRVAADGTTWVTLRANAGAGLEFSTPGVEAGSDDLHASSPKGEFSVTGKGEFARTWKLGSEDDAHDFIGHMVDKVVALADPIPNFLQGADDYDPPDADSDTIYGGVSVTGSASAGGGAYAGASGGIEGGVGAQYYANGDTTFFFRARANASGNAGLDFAGGFGVSGDGSVTIAITYDKDGHEKTMTVLGVGGVAGGIDFQGTQDGLSGVLKGIEAATVAGNAQSGKRIEFQSTLDLTKPENRAAARAFLDGRDPDTGQPVSLTRATADLYDRFDADAATNVRTYDLDQTELGVDVDGSVLGFSAKYASHDANLSDAWFDPGPGGFQHWFDCAAAAT
jgi:hypothetical protein